MKRPATPDGYKRATDKIKVGDEFWNWQDGRFEDAHWLAGQSIDVGEQYIIRKLPKPKHTWSRKLAVLVINKEK